MSLLQKYAGRTVTATWDALPKRYQDVEVDVFVAMPKVIGYLKMNSAKRINQTRNTPGTPVWQRNYTLTKTGAID